MSQTIYLNFQTTNYMVSIFKKSLSSLMQSRCGRAQGSFLIGEGGSQVFEAVHFFKMWYIYVGLCFVVAADVNHDPGLHSISTVSQCVNNVLQRLLMYLSFIFYMKLSITLPFSLSKWASLLQAVFPRECTDFIQRLDGFFDTLLSTPKLLWRKNPSF